MTSDLGKQELKNYKIQIKFEDSSDPFPSKREK